MNRRSFAAGIFAAAAVTPAAVDLWMNRVDASSYSAANIDSLQDSVTALERILAGPWVHNLLGFGGKGNGSFDNSTALANACAAAAKAGGGQVVIPTGTYSWSSKLTVPAGVRISGAGNGVTVLNWTGGAIPDTSAALTLGSGSGLENLTVQGSLGGRTAKGKLVAVGGVADVTIWRCKLKSTGSNTEDGAALFVKPGTSGLQVMASEISSSAAHTIYGILTGGESDFVFFGNRIYNTMESGATNLLYLIGNGAVAGHNPQDLIIQGNNFGPCAGGNAISVMNRWDRVSIHGNTIRGCTRMGIEINGNAGGNGTRATHVNIGGNIVDYNGLASVIGWPISVSTVDRATVTANGIDGANARGMPYGIEIVDCTKATCTANPIDRVVGDGIIINNSPRTTCVGNVLDAIGGSGIRVYGGASQGMSSAECTISANVLYRTGNAGSVNRRGVAAIDMFPGAGTVHGAAIEGNTIDTVGQPSGSTYSMGIRIEQTDIVVGGNRLANIASGVKIGGSPTAPYGRVYHNQGYNPLGPQAGPSIPASGTPLPSPFALDCTVHVTGGTVSEIAIGGTPTGLTGGTFRIPAGQTVTLTYTTAPAWTWFAD